jgi:hypothetical protein
MEAAEEDRLPDSEVVGQVSLVLKMPLHSLMMWYPPPDSCRVYTFIYLGSSN